MSVKLPRAADADANCGSPDTPGQTADAVRLNSSNLCSADYDPWSGTLVIVFHGARIYEYYRVPHAEFYGLVNASSHGKYFHEHIKDHYDCRRVG